MEHKLYIYEIVLNLLKAENHLRKIAKDLKINHMTIKRALDALVKENVLDVKEQGRNNIFTIKKTLEAQSIVLMAEAYKLMRLLKRHPELKQSISELKKLPTDLIVMFGSYAKGSETKDSDIDIFIETKDKKIREKAKLHSKFSIKIGDYEKENLLIKEIEKIHIILKGVESFYEKNNFFG